MRCIHTYVEDIITGDGMDFCFTEDGILGFTKRNTPPTSHNDNYDGVYPPEDVERSRGKMLGGM